MVLWYRLVSHRMIFHYSGGKLVTSAGLASTGNNYLVPRAFSGAK